MKRILFRFILLTGACLYLLQCKAVTSEDAGGSGADFDSALYYTRYEIDSKLNALTMTLGSQLKYANATAQPVSGLGYENGTTSWTIPSGYSGVIFQIIAVNSDSSFKTVNVHFADGEHSYGNGSDWSTKIIIPPGGSAQVPGIVSINSKTGPVKAWLDEAGDWDSYLTVKAAPVYWIR